MIEHLVCALLTNQVASTLGARRAEHAQTVRPRDLHCGRADTAARTMDQYRLARLRLRTLDQPAKRRRVWRSHRRTLCERSICRQRMQLNRIAERILRIRAAD